MSPRATWKGYLQLGVLSCPINLYPASTQKEKISFNKIEESTKTRLKQQYVNGNGDVVESFQQARGYEVAKNDYILIKDEELDNLKCEATKTVKITKFVKESEIDLRYYEKPYFLAPNDKVGHDAFLTIAEGMRAEGVVAIATVVLSRRERTIMLKPYDKGIMGVTLRFNYEVRECDAYFEDIPAIQLPKDYLDLGKTLVQIMTKSAFDPKSMIDRYEDAIVELIKQKQSGHVPAPQPEAPQPINFHISMKELLHLSIANANNDKSDEELLSIAAEKAKERVKATAKPQTANKKSKKAELVR